MALFQLHRAPVAGQGSREPFPALLVHPTREPQSSHHQMSTPAAGTYPSQALGEQITPECTNGHARGRAGSAGKVSVSSRSTAGWVTHTWFMAAGKVMEKATWGCWLNMTMVYGTLFSPWLCFSRNVVFPEICSPGVWNSPKAPVHWIHVDCAELLELQLLRSSLAKPGAR